MSVDRDWVEEMRQLAADTDTEQAHVDADTLLVEFIQDNINTDQARKLIGWYANVRKWYA